MRLSRAKLEPDDLSKYNSGAMTDKDQLLLLKKGFTRLIDFLQKSWDPSGKIIRSMDPLTIEASLSFDFDSAQTADFWEQLQIYLDTCTKTSHPFFCDRLCGAPSEITLLSGMVELFSNVTMSVYKASSVSTVIETELIRKLNTMAGFLDGDGIFTPGGTFSNTVAVLCARHHYFPQIKVQGLGAAPPLSICVSDQAHYSFDISANQMGLGTSAVYRVASDDMGRMIPKALESAILQCRRDGKTPFFVSATSGTTVTGNFDPLPEIAAICRAQKLWFHVDAAYGGATLFSDTHKHLMSGCHMADSMTWDFHKQLGIPIPCSVILTQSKTSLSAACAPMTDFGNTNYIFSAKNRHDLGKKALQCARPSDALKLWITWLYLGNNGMAERIDTLFEKAEALESLIKEAPNCELMSKRESTNVCFRIRPQLDTIDIDAFNQALNQTLTENRDLFISDMPLKGHHVLRPAFTQTSTDPIVLLTHILKAAKTLEKSWPQSTISTSAHILEKN
ncbi:MAG: glutamate/tyrosine decarboxylase-like PLP-dependent enzyme [Candidatus Marinamargulisbacteria bacterium]|jgi:glutamate/tyrosine decarboxylase-like PLP-dependent enzyme